MKLILILLIFFPAETQAHHWITFISCGFTEAYEDTRGVDTIVPPNFGRVFVRLTSIAFIRGYRPEVPHVGPSCSTIYVSGGIPIHVIGSADNVVNRINRQYMRYHQGQR